MQREKALLSWRALVTPFINHIQDKLDTVKNFLGLPFQNDEELELTLSLEIIKQS